MLESPRTSEKVQPVKSSRPGKKGRFVLIAIALAVIAAIGAIWYYSANRPSDDWKTNTVTVEKGSIDVRIIATGTIRPVNEIKVSPKSTGLIKRLYVQQGDEVKEGQIIAQMDDSNLKGQIEAARGTYQMANDNYLKMRNGNRPQEVEIAQLNVRRARDIVRQAEQNIIRLKAQVESATQQALRDDTMSDRQTYLESQGAVSEQDKLNAEVQSKVTRATLDAAKRELGQAQATLAQNKSEMSAAKEQHELSRIGNRSEDIAASKDAVLQAKGSLDTLESQLNDMTIKAPFTGVITQKYADAGAIVTPTTSAATTSATSSSIVALAGKLEMVAQVSETDIGKIQLGQKVEIISNAYPEMSFFGHVTQIAPEAVVTQNVTTFEVHSSVDDKPPELTADQGGSTPEAGSGDGSGGNGSGSGGGSGHKHHGRHRHHDEASSDSTATTSGDVKNTSEPTEKSEQAKPAAPKLLSGMNISARFVAGRHDDAMLVPTVCIISRHGRTGVLVPDPSGTPKFQKVKAGATEDTKTEIISGVKVGDLVFQGLNKQQLEKNGYADGGDKQRNRDGGGGGRGGGAPIPRSFGR